MLDFDTIDYRLWYIDFIKKKKNQIDTNYNEQCNNRENYNKRKELCELTNDIRPKKKPEKRIQICFV